MALCFDHLRGLRAVEIPPENVGHEGGFSARITAKRFLGQLGGDLWPLRYRLGQSE